MARAGQLRHRKARRAAAAAPAAAALLLLATLGRPAAPAPAWAGAARPSRVACRAAARTGPQALQASVDLETLKAQSAAGHALKDLGARLQSAEYEASALDGKVRVVYDGTQRLKAVDIADGALESVDGDRDAFQKALLGALQEAHEASEGSTRGDKWGLYKRRRELMDAPLNQIGAGSTVQDPWENVTRSDDSVKLATELFEKFDEDLDGYWNLNETSQVQMATEGTEMAEEAFTSLIISVAEDGGRHLSETDLANGLSKAQVIELYTDAARQRQLGFVLDVFKDHAKVFATEAGAEEAEVETAAAATGTPSLD